ncbi:MAG: valine--tRNA ligase [Deltaproteobacteria bacterium]|nr:MAG: valine--tRNA ligase [Deltaproteobacteria bacterium]
MAKAALPKQYDPTDVEPRWLKAWLEHGYYHADAAAPKAPFSVTLPPPNVTGSLHMGHALGSTLQDILVRWRRMQGFNAMWMPGTDHAGIATQMLVERDLMRSEGKTRHDIGRDAFLERAWQWKERYGGRILEQMKALGFSLDFDRMAFTLDEPRQRAVREAFVSLYEQGLIYRANRLVNWCTDCQTAVSDLEVDNVEEPGHLWELKYPIAGTDRVITVATTRPETMLGDTGVAVHPDDDRYRDLVGKEVELPLTGRRIPIVADSFVDPEFGTGAVKVTPGHDFNDFECGKRCGLEQLSVIDKSGRIVPPAPDKYVGMTVAEARKAVVADLDALGLLGAVVDRVVPRGRCQRSRTVIEPLLSEQWWVATEPLARPAIEAVERGKTRFVPELWTKTYMHWMRNIKDWCISRQLWWGHRIPAWFCDACGGVTVAREDPTACSACGSGDIRQDEDVLDTWFSSGLWPFSTLGWPDDSRDLRTFYPNSVMVTGPDIIFFWVARMMMMGLHFMKKVPFRTVYLTPIVTDEAGDKMSKTKGNVIDPLDVVHGATLEDLLAKAEREHLDDAAIKTIRKLFPKGIPQCGADALRLSLAAMALPGRYLRLSVERIEGYRNFVNKLWNASRFALMHLDDFDAERFADAMADGPEAVDLAAADRWILSRLQRVAAVVDEALEAFRFADAANALYHFVWGELCDWYIELAKPALQAGGDAGDAAARRRFAAQGTLATVLESTLRLLHPFIPFVTEEIWQKLPKPAATTGSLMVTIYPRADERFVDGAAERELGLMMEVATAIRTLRSTYGVPPSRTVRAEVRCADADKRAVLEAHRGSIETVARVDLAIAETGGPVPQSAKSVVGADIEVVVPLGGLIDIDAERQRIEKEIRKADREIAFVEKKLANERFVQRAPEAVVEKERARLADERARRERLVEALAALDA